MSKEKFAKKSIDKLAGDSEEMESEITPVEPTRFVERSIMLGISLETPRGWLKGATQVRMREEVCEGEDHESVSALLGKLVHETAEADMRKLIKDLGGKK